MTQKFKTVKTLIINNLVLCGKKELSEKILFKTIKQLQKRSTKNHKNLLESLIIKTVPVIKIKQIKRRKKQFIKFPYILKKKSRYIQAIKNIVKISEKKFSKNFCDKLTQELTLNVKNINKDKKILHEHAFTTKKFANFRWFK